MKIRKIHNNLKAIFLSGFLLVFLGANAQYISTEDSIAIAKERARGSIMPRTSNRPAVPNANSISVNRDAAIVTYTPAELVEKIFLKSQGGDCATEGVIEDVTLHALNWTGTAWSATSPEYNRSMSYFSGGQTTGTRVLGIESGILLTTGPGLYAEGPNGSGSGAQSALNGGKALSDADLQALTTNGINCGTVLEFTFTPQSSQISFEYVFGSEEYPNYSNNQTYNDVFGFFISDEDGVSNKRNIAIVPGTTDLPVAIYNVNQLRNTEYFVNCYTTAGQQVEYNGHTTVLTAKANVEPGKKYRLKLAIANVGDSSYGSGVFLKAGSFDLGLGITNHGNEIQGMDNVFQACESNKFTLKINKSSVARTIGMTYSGAALNFIKQPDGSNMPATINVPAYSTEVSVPYKVLSTVSTNGGDFNIKATIPGCGEITKTIYVYQQFLSATVKTTPSCNGNDGSLYVEATGGSPRVEMSRNGGGDWQKIAVPFTGLAPGSYTVMVRDSIGCNTETLTAVVTGKPVINNTFTETTVCAGTIVPKVTLTSTVAGTTYVWTCNNSAIGLTSGTGDIPQFTAKNTTTGQLEATITVTPTAFGCVGVSKSYKIIVNPVADVKPISNLTVCNNSLVSSIPFETTAMPTNKVTYTWKNNNAAIGLVASGSGSNLPSFTAINSGTAPVTATIEVTPKYEDCIGTPLSFTITVNPTAIVKPIANLTVCNNSQVPSIPFETTATPSGKVTYTWKNSNTAIGLAASGSGSGLPSFTATNSTNNPVTAAIEVTPKYENCEGTKLTFTIIVNAPVMAGVIKGNSFVCQNQNPLEIKEIAAASGGSNSFTYQWKSSIDAIIWTDIPGAKSISYTPGILATDTHFKRMTIDGFCGQQFESNTFTIKVVTQPTALYWKSTAGDSNWNNPDNWIDKDGNQLGMVPLACTDVQITGGSDNYPSLDLASTPVDLYGTPQCRNITFQYGAEVACQYKLAYEKAFVQYNWGYYSNTSGLPEGIQPDKNGSGSPCLVKERDTWYALAAPLKNMASGDFSFGGFPVTWQGGFNIQDPVTGQSVEVEAGDFSKAYARNDINLAETNNAVAIKVPSYRNQIGYNNHCHMDGLEGVMEFPYFENEAKAPFYPAHTYDKFTRESKFFYFDTKTLQLIYSPVGRMKRGAESYRFIYETSSNEVKNISVGGNNVPGYAQEISKHIASSQKVMIGNPFMASINSKRFLDANNIDPGAPKLLASDGYFVFNSTLQIWQNLPFSATNNIGPQQAFIVTLAEGVNNTELLYPFEGTYALTGPTFRGLSQVLPEGSSLYLKTSDNNDAAGDYAILNASQTGDNLNNVKKMIYTEGHVVPETFFITSDGKDYNLVQAFEEGIKEIGIGVKCSNTQKPLKFTFENVSEFYSTYGVRPVLVDKFMSIEQDLTDNYTYHFNQRKTTVENRYIDADRFVLRMASPDDIVGNVNEDIHIVYQNDVLNVKSGRTIKTVHVYDLYGRLIHSNRQINLTVYSQPLSLAQGLYIVKVQTVNGKTKVEKIMAL
ncbi:MAG: choice-of-anchor L domain-containing protein [Prevotella sp.]|jgi:hypothetical protein|nr:choice-of-anchor L domain-containing protein [Prevotella sp.]